MRKKNLKKTIVALICALGFALSSGMTAFAQTNEIAPSAAATRDAAAVTPAPAAMSSGIVITGYMVQNAAGQELQSVKPGEKCTIVISLRVDDGIIPTQTDSYGNIVNAKITTTTSFQSPTLGDIKQTTPQVSGTGYVFALIFNDITYLGGENTLGFDVSYIDQSMAMQSLSVGISQCQNVAEGTTGAKASIMVQDSSYGGANVASGTTFALSLTSYNTSTSTALTDVVTTLTLPAEITLAGGSNTVLTPSVSAGGTFSNTFSLMAQNSAETGIANITVNYTYYIKGSSEQLSSSQMITVPIEQPDRFSFSKMDVPSDLTAGEDGYITVSFVNKGKGILYNLSAELAGNMDNTGETQYVGNVQPGSEGSVDFAVKCAEAKTISGTVTITYEDINGNEKTQTQQFTATFSEPQMMDMPDDGGMMPDDGGEGASAGVPWWVWVLIGAGALVAIIVLVVVVKKKKKKRQMELDMAEDDDDEDF